MTIITVRSMIFLQESQKDYSAKRPSSFDASRLILLARLKCVAIDAISIASWSRARMRVLARDSRTIIAVCLCVNFGYYTTLRRFVQFYTGFLLDFTHSYPNRIN